MARSGLKLLGPSSRSVLAELCESGQIRRAHTELGTPTESGMRYTPNPFSRTTPYDKSLLVFKKNPYIESFMHRRDKLEREFSWNLRHTVEIAYFIIGIGAAFGAMGTFAIRQADKSNGYPKRDMLMASSSTGFILPDEREWY